MSGCTASGGAAEPTPGPTSAPSAVGRFATAAELGEAVQGAALDAGSATGTIDARSSDGSLDGTLRYEFEPGGVRLAGDVAVSGPLSADVALVLVEDTAYLRVPPLYQVFAGAPWVRLPPTGESDLAQQSAALLDALGTQVPGAALTSPDADAATLAYLGPEVVDGDPVERYRVQADDGTTTTTQDYWVDDDDLLVRLDAAVEGPAGVSATSTRTYGDWGDPVRVQPPPAQDVADLPPGLF